jgi:hypothetical protein
MKNRKAVLKCPPLLPHTNFSDESAAILITELSFILIYFINKSVAAKGRNVDVTSHFL